MGRTSDYSYLGKFSLINNTNEKLIAPDTSGIIQTPLFTKKNLTYLANSNGKILIFDNNLFVNSIPLPAGVFVESGMCADNDRNVYAIGNDGILYSYTPKAELRWKKQFGTGKKYEVFSTLVCSGDLIIAASSSGKTTAFSLDGKEKFSIITTLEPITTFPISRNKLYLPLTDNLFAGADSLAAYDMNGKIIWKSEFPNFRILNCVLSGTGKLILSGEKMENNIKKNISFIIDTNGTILHQLELAAAPRYASTDKKGNVYFLAFDIGVGEPQTGIYKYDSTGKRLWYIYYDGAAACPAMIDSRFLAVTATTSRGLGVFFFSQENGNLVKALSLSNAPPVYPKPGVNDNGELMYSGLNGLRYIRITNSGLDKLLPF